MTIGDSAAQILAAKALDYRAMRQDMISSNIANADTPFYRPRDISFEESLRVEKAKLMNESKKELEMAKTSPKHLEALDSTATQVATLFFRDGHTARNDGNSVDLDVETTEMSKNFVMYNALVNAMKKDSAIYKSVIDSSSKVG